MKIAFLFPGQGSQSVGMGRALGAASPAAAAVWREADRALGFPLSRLCFEGPGEELQLTANTQPAVLTASVAAAAALGERGVEPDLCAGHSLGEYSAMVVTGAIGFGDAVRLVRKRGEFMQEAVPVGAGAMAALLGLDLDAARAVAEEAAQGQVCAVANDNGAGQVVVSGDKAAVERAVAVAATKGAKRSILLPVSAPFHCPLMAPAAREMEEALAEVELREPYVPLVANVTAAPVSEPEEIKSLLVAQVTGLVRWRESVLAMKAAGVTELVELGAGRVLSGLAKRIDRELATASVGGPAEIEAFVKTL